MDALKDKNHPPASANICFFNDGARGFPNSKSQSELLAGEALRHCGFREPGGFKLDRSPKGKVIVNPPVADISVTHTVRACAVAVTADGKIGADMERCGRRISNSMINWLLAGQGSNEEKVSYLSALALWCMNEAFHKALGRGLSSHWISRRMASLVVEKMADAISRNCFSELNIRATRWSFFVRFHRRHLVVAAFRVKRLQQARINIVDVKY